MGPWIKMDSPILGKAEPERKRQHERTPGRRRASASDRGHDLAGRWNPSPWNQAIQNPERETASLDKR
jgi:hypothetical protein